MYRDKRDYRAVSFCTPSLKTAREVLTVFPRSAITQIEPISSGIEGISILRCSYLRKKPFRIIPEPERLIDPQTGKYKYDMYCLQYTENTNLSILAVPLMDMAIEVFGRLHTIMRGQEMRYQTVDFDKLYQSLEVGKKAEGTIRIDRMEFRIDGDETLDHMGFNGQDILNSFCYPAIRKSLKSRKGVELVPIGCRINHQNIEGKRFWLQIDSQGNLLFHISSDARNLHRIRNLLSFLRLSGATTMTSAFPLRERKKKEDYDE